MPEGRDALLYGFHAIGLDGQDCSLADFAGQVLLVVNTASLCGFTGQYAGLETLYRRYHSRGFSVLAFPCNQFGNQEPGDGDSIAQTCYSRFGVTFPVFARIEVKGGNAHPLFRHLTGSLPGWFGAPVRWNFTKFLVDAHGRPLRRYAPRTAPERIGPAIEGALSLRQG